MNKLSLESSWSHICVGTTLWLLTALTYLIWYDKLHWFIPDKRVFWFPGYSITREGKWIPHCVSGCVCGTLLCHSSQCGHSTLGQAQGAQQDTPSGFARAELSASHLCSWLRIHLCVRMEKLGGNGLSWPTTHPSWHTGSSSPPSVLFLFISVCIRNNNSAIRQWRWEES